ncbi:MAG: hypothetical protein U0Q12_15830 [Vicinamibacterales bacterium]
MRFRARAAAPALALGGLLTLACATTQIEDVAIDDRRVVVSNTSAGTWRHVEIWVNDYYRVTAAELGPGGRVEAPLDTFVAGFGQRFDVRRARVRGAYVTFTNDRDERERRDWKGR